MKKIFAWFLYIAVTLYCLGTSAYHYLGYGLFTPHSNIVYTGITLILWKSLLVLAITALGILILHLIMTGRVLYQNNISQALKLSLIFFLIVAIPSLLSYIVSRIY